MIDHFHAHGVQIAGILVMEFQPQEGFPGLLNRLGLSALHRLAGQQFQLGRVADIVDSFAETLPGQGVDHPVLGSGRSS